MYFRGHQVLFDEIERLQRRSRIEFEQGYPGSIDIRLEFVNRAEEVRSRELAGEIIDGRVCGFEVGFR